MKVADFDYVLPNDLIADKPVLARDESRLLVLEKNGLISHRKFRDILELLHKGDVLVFNNTKVFPARLIGQKSETGGRVEMLLNHEVDDGCWEVIGKNLNVGNKIIFNHSDLTAKVMEKHDQIVKVQFNLSGDGFFTEIEKIGIIPLPPYIEAKRKLNHTLYDKDKERYQTVYAKDRGSVAAPTAGLHFTAELIDALVAKGVIIKEVTLHVGLGTFAPVTTENVEDHQIHEELFSISRETHNDLLKLKENGHRIIAVGTTTTRVLESVFRDFPATKPLKKDEKDWTNIYIYPSYKFKFVDGMITNFHLPKSSLLFLVSAFAGKDNIMNAYDEAIKEKYRFYSYGDAMFITK